MTAQTKKRLTVVSASTVIGGLVVIVSGLFYLKSQAQSILVTPVLETAVSKQVTAAKEECQRALSKHVDDDKKADEKNEKKFDKQADVNESILNALTEIKVGIAELKTEARIRNRRGNQE